MQQEELDFGKAEEIPGGYSQILDDLDSLLKMRIRDSVLPSENIKPDDLIKLLLALKKYFEELPQQSGENGAGERNSRLFELIFSDKKAKEYYDKMLARIDHFK